ncbi:MAG: hypothetical protein K2H28_07645 [Ruminococcus sp.]|nr:hypothetical protein [Ruminococcus sp.]
MNQIKYISKSEIPYIKCSNSFIVEIDGKTIQSENDWLYTMAEKFHFPVDDGQKNIDWFSGAFEYPRKYLMNRNRFNDWITDLEWLETNSIILIIFNYADFIADSYETKKYITDDLQNIIDFWENDAEKCIFCGQRKDFNVYIVETN